MKEMSNTKVFWFSTLAVLLLILSGFSYWLSSTIFNQEVFVNETVAVMTAPETTQAIAAGIVDKTLADKPVARNLLGNKLTGVVSGLLSTDTFADVVRGVSGRIYLQITSEDPKGVVIDTTAVKSLVTPIANVVASPEQKAKLEGLNIPDEIVLVDPEAVPTIYPLTSFLWIWPFALLGAIGIVTFVLYNTIKERRLLTTQMVASVFAGFGFTAAAIIPSIEPTIIKNIDNYNLKLVASNIYEGLSAPLFDMYVTLTAISIAVIVVVYLFQVYVKWADKKLKTSK